MSRKQQDRELSEEKLSEAGMNIFPHDGKEGKEGLEKILESIQHRGAVYLTKQLFDFEHILAKELIADFIEETSNKSSNKSSNKLKEIPDSKQYLFVPKARPDKTTTPSKLDDYEFMYSSCLRVGRRVRFPAKQIADVAGSIGANDERRWELLMHRFVFEKFHKMIRKAEKTKTKRALQEKELMNDFRIGNDHCWENGRALLEENRQLRGDHDPLQLTAPKPDLYFAYYLHALSDYSSFKNSSEFSDSVNPNFSFETLRDLAQISKLYDAGNRRFHPSHLMDYTKDLPKDDKCRVGFPWLIGEWKHPGVDGGQRKRVVWQAANGCAVALTILARLATRHLRTKTRHDIHPVFAITSIGADASLWVAFVRDFVKDGPLSFEMHRIWQGDLKLHLCTIELYVFLDRLHVWAVGSHRRWISECIGDWACKLRVHSSTNSIQTELSAESSNIDPQRTATAVAQAKEIRQRRDSAARGTSPDGMKASRPVKESTQTVNCRPTQDSELAEDCKSVTAHKDATSLNHKSGSEYLLNQREETDSDNESCSTIDEDWSYEVHPTKGAKSDKNPSSDYKPHDKVTSSKDIARSSQIETPPPRMYHSRSASKQKSPDITSVATGTSQQHEYLNTPPKTPGQRTMPALDAQKPLSRSKRSSDPTTPISNPSTPSLLHVSTHKVTRSKSAGDARDLGTSKIVRNAVELEEQDEPREEIHVRRDFTPRSDGLFSILISRPASTGSNPRKSERHAQSLGSPNGASRATKTLTPNRTDPFFDTNTHADITLRGRRTVSAPLFESSDPKETLWS